MTHNPYDDIDEVILDATLAGRISAKGLSPAERIWLVGQLTERGETIPAICKLTGMSRRTAQRLRARYYSD